MKARLIAWRGVESMMDMIHGNYRRYVSIYLTDTHVVVTADGRRIHVVRQDDVTQLDGYEDLGEVHVPLQLDIAALRMLGAQKGIDSHVDLIHRLTKEIKEELVQPAHQGVIVTFVPD